MKITRFEDVESWKEARKIVKEIYALYRSCKDYSFKDQIQRAGLSIMSNVAEGFDRGTNKEFIQFLIIARGSVSEVKSLSYASLDIGHTTFEQFTKIIEQCTALSNLINGFIRYLRSSDRKK
jgi:four helix bundle protein